MSTDATLNQSER